MVGPNGAGKSTLFGMIAGLIRPTSGDVVLPGSGNILGYLPQEVRFPSRATPGQFLDYVGWIQKLPRRDREAAVHLALTRVGLEVERDHRISTLSGGMVRRLGIAHALLADPPLLILDEPTVGLDPLQRASLRETIACLAPGRVVLVSTHLVEDVRGMADRVLVIGEGALMFDGSVPQLEQRCDASAPGDTPLSRRSRR